MYNLISKFISQCLGRQSPGLTFINQTSFFFFLFNKLYQLLELLTILENIFWERKQLYYKIDNISPHAESKMRNV